MSGSPDLGRVGRLWVRIRPGLGSGLGQDLRSGSGQDLDSIR